MFIAVRKGRNGSWVLVDERAPGQSPEPPTETVPVGQMVELIPGISLSVESFRLPGSRLVDVVGIDAHGNLTLALCRLAATPEIRQACVARLLDFAGRLRREVPFREFVQRIELLANRPLESLVAERLGEEERERFDPAAFRRRLADNLDRGRFRLVLAVDRISDEFQALLDFIQESSEGLIRFHPVEIAVFEHGGWQVMMPRVRREGEPEPIAAGGYSVEMGFDGQVGPDCDAFESIEEYEEYLEREAMAAEAALDGLDEMDGAPAPEVVMSISGRRHDEERFLDRLEENTTDVAVRRARRLLELGREPTRALPAGWIVSTDALSFQAALVREGVEPPEPVVAEIFRLDEHGRVVIDLPLLRILVSDDSVDSLLRDLEASNPALAGAVGPAEERCEIPLEDAFDSDYDVRSFCVSIRKLVLGLGLVGGHGDREAA